MSDAHVPRVHQLGVRRHRAEHGAQPATLTINNRDLEILYALGTAPWLTAQGLEWLFWPTWRERWSRWKAADDAAAATGVPKDQRPSYKITTACYVRLDKLEAAHYIARIVRTVAVAEGTFNRVEDLLALTQQGARELERRVGVPTEQLYVYKRGERSVYTLEHTMEISRIYAALRARLLETATLRMEQWRGDHRTARDEGRLRVVLHDRGGKAQPRALQPDGAFFLRSSKRRVLFFVENDRERAIESWVDKIRRYVALFGTDDLAAKYEQATTFGLLAVTTTEQQRQALIRATREALAASPVGQAVAGQFYFGLQQDVHPRTIGSCWRNVRNTDHTLILDTDTSESGL